MDLLVIHTTYAFFGNDIFCIRCVFVNFLSKGIDEKIIINLPGGFLGGESSYEDNLKWSAFNTQKFIYNTVSSWNLRYTFYSDGTLANF